jgi:hypothetical protein
MLFLQLAEFWKDMFLWNPKPLSAVFTKLDSNHKYITAEQ